MIDSVNLPEEGMLLRVFISEEDSYKGKPLYEQIVKKARELHLAGATVIRGILGFGANSRMHTAKILRLSEDLPVIVEIVDTITNIDKITPFLDEVVPDGMVTLEKVRILKYKGKEG